MAPKSKEHLTEVSPLLVDTSLATKSDDLPLWRRIKEEVSEQMDTALPTLQSMVLTKIPWLISLRFVGGIGAQELAAAALATTLCNVTGLSLSVGLSSALSTLTGQAKGELHSRLIHEKRRRVSFDLAAENEERQKDLDPASGISLEEDKEPITPLVFLYRGMVIQLALVIPVGVWWLFGVKDVLISLGQTEVLSSRTEAYLKILAPGLWAYSVNWTLTAWVQSIGMADVPAYAAILGLAVHVPFNWFFIDFLDMGYLGAAVATVCFQVIQPIFILTYLFILAYGRRRVLESTGGLIIGRTRLSFWKEFAIAVSSIRGYIQYMSLALPGIVIISEWWASETAIFLAGRLEPNPELAVGGMTIYQSLNSFCFMFPVAFSIAASTRVGNLLGAGQPKGAAFAANVSIASAACLSLVMGSLLYGIPHTFLPSLFAPDEEELILETSRTIPLLSIYVFADGIQVALNGIIKGCGRQCVTMPIVIVAYWVVAIPLAYYIVFVRNDRQMFCDDSYFCGDVGLVAAMTTGTWVHMLLLALVVGSTTDWEVEARKAKQRVANEE
jgi:MATE family multidrug resistance protein